MTLLAALRGWLERRRRIADLTADDLRNDVSRRRPPIVRDRRAPWIDRRPRWERIDRERRDRVDQEPR